MRFNKLVVSLVALMGLPLAAGFLAPSEKVDTPQVLAPSKAHLVAKDGGSEPTPLTTTQMYLRQKSRSISGNTQSFSFTFSAKYTARAGKFAQVYLAIEDPDFIEGEQKKHTGSETDPIPGFDAKAASVAGKGTSVDYDDTHGGYLVAFPEYINHSDNYLFNLIKIGSNSMSESSQYSDVYGIYIPSTVTSIEENAFVNVPASVTIYCESEAKPEGWAANWTDAANVLFGQSKISLRNEFSKTFKLNISGEATDEAALKTINEEVFRRKSSLTKNVSTNFNASLGYDFDVNYTTYDEVQGKNIEVKDHITEKLKITYDVKKSNGSTETRVMDREISNTRDGYDAVGTTTGSDEQSIDIDINVAEGEDVVSESFVFSNIYRIGRALVSTKDEGTGVVTSDYTGPFVPYVDSTVTEPSDVVGLCLVYPEHFGYCLPEKELLCSQYGEFL